MSTPEAQTFDEWYAANEQYLVSQPFTNYVAAAAWKAAETYAAAREAAELAEVARLRADAERYRWLRATTNWASSNGERIDVRNNPELWDAAIDAAMEERRPA